MKERPIIFSGAMVRALLAGTKTQTRRVAKEFAGRDDLDAILRRFPNQNGCPYGQPGDRLWVRETFFAWGRWETRYSAKKGRDEWHFIDMTVESGRKYLYAADNKNYAANLGANQGRGLYPSWWKRPAIHMPRWASRINLEIISVRVERLQSISEADVLAEGITLWPLGFRVAESGPPEHYSRTFDVAADAYRWLWNSINGPDTWAANPWVWVIEFRRLS